MIGETTYKITVSRADSDVIKNLVDILENCPMGYGGETWQYWVILVLMTVYGGAFACEKDKEELE